MIYIWQDSYGRTFKTYAEIEDIHLANIITHLKTKKDNRVSQLPMFIKEAKRRGLSEEFLSRAEIPHRHPKKNHWMLWNDQANQPMPVSKK